MIEGRHTTSPNSAADAMAEAVHVAGVIDAAEAELLIECGVRRIGIPLVLGHHREDIDVDDAAALVGRYGAGAEFFLITYLGDAPSILSLCQRLGVRMVQLHGEVTVGALAALREADPGLFVIRSLIVGQGSQETLKARVGNEAPLVDAFITDTFDPETGATGATGKTHDWGVSERLVALSPKPIILAGGLTPSNVGDAIRAVRPAGVDVHTGIEGADGRKRRDLTLAFLSEATAGFASIRD